jgi:hypothetical protein
VISLQVMIQLHREVEQNNGDTTDAVHISLLIWCWTTFCLQYSQSLEWAHTSFEQFLVEFYTILPEEHLKVALEMLEVGICSSF